MLFCKLRRGVSHCVRGSTCRAKRRLFDLIRSSFLLFRDHARLRLRFSSASTPVQPNSIPPVSQPSSNPVPQFSARSSPAKTPGFQVHPLPYHFPLWFLEPWSLSAAYVFGLTLARGWLQEIRDFVLAPSVAAYCDPSKGSQARMILWMDKILHHLRNPGMIRFPRKLPTNTGFNHGLMLWCDTAFATIRSVGLARLRPRHGLARLPARLPPRAPDARPPGVPRELAGGRSEAVRAALRDAQGDADNVMRAAARDPCSDGNGWGEHGLNWVAC